MENSVLADSEVVQKKRRRTGWDAPASQPSSSSGPSGPTLMNPAVSVVTGLNAPNQLLAHQQAQQILLAQQVLAQSVAAAAVKTGLPLAPQSASMTVTNAVAPMISMMIPTPYVPRPECRIYVGVTEADVKALFAPFGAVMKIDMSFDPSTGRSKGYCFLEFQDPDSVAAALEMNGFEIGTRKIKVGKPATAAATTAPSALPVGLPTGASDAQTIADAKQQAQLLLAQALGGKTVSVTGEAAGGTLNSSDNKNGDTTNGIVTGDSGSVKHPKESKSVIVRNVLVDFSQGDLQKVFAAFGRVHYCDFFGPETPYITPKTNGEVAITIAVGNEHVQVRSALIEYAGASSAAEAVRNMNKFHFGGPLLEVEQADEHTASTVRTSKTESAEITSSSPSSSSLTSATGTAVAGKQGWNGTGAHVHKSIRDNHCVVILENLVSVAEAADPSLKGEVGEEAERFGPLEDLEIFIDPRKVVVVVLTYTDRGNAQRAYEAFNGRFFGGRQISARIGASSL